MATHKPDKPASNQPAKSASKPSVSSDEQTLELTKDEIDSFGADGSKPVHTGGKHAKPKPSK